MQGLNVWPLGDKVAANITLFIHITLFYVFYVR